MTIDQFANALENLIIGAAQAGVPPPIIIGLLELSKLDVAGHIQKMPSKKNAIIPMGQLPMKPKNQ